MQQWLSLDGYIANRNGQLDFFTAHGKDNKYSDADQLQLLETVDTILFGRITYELFVDFWPTATIDIEPIADKLNEIPKIVFSNTLTKAPWGKLPEVKVVNGDAMVAMKQLKSLPGKNMILWGSISLAQQLMKENLIDEYHIQLCPILLGGGRPLFAEQINPSELSLVELKHYDTGTVLLNYHPSK